MDDFTLKEIEAMETISSGHTDDLKVENGVTRVWLSRMTMADGMEYDNQVTVERLENGKWSTIKEYEAL